MRVAAVKRIDLLHQPRQFLSQASFESAVGGAEPRNVGPLIRAVALQRGEPCPVMPEDPLLAPAWIDAKGQPRNQGRWRIARAEVRPVRLGPRRSRFSTPVLFARSCRL